jgi:hypothetical protein
MAVLVFLNKHPASDLNIHNCFTNINVSKGAVIIMVVAREKRLL